MEGRGRHFLLWIKDTVCSPVCAHIWMEVKSYFFYIKWWTLSKNPNDGHQILSNWEGKKKFIDEICLKDQKKRIHVWGFVSEFK